jgi:hypothetical protein
MDKSLHNVRDREKRKYLMTSQITSVKLIGRNTLETDAFGGCYIDARDFEAREQLGPDLWRMFDHDDGAIPDSGPLYQYADGAMVSKMAELLQESA